MRCWRPVAGVLLGVAILGERLSAGLVGGMALVALVGVDRADVERPGVGFPAFRPPLAICI